jgi:hypothetical protein
VSFFIGSNMTLSHPMFRLSFFLIFRHILSFLAEVSWYALFDKYREVLQSFLYYQNFQFFIKNILLKYFIKYIFTIHNKYSLLFILNL